MAEIDGAYLSAELKRQRIEEGNSVYYPWGNRNKRAVQMNVSDIMGNSKTKYWYKIQIEPGQEEDPTVFHKLWIIPGEGPAGWDTAQQGGWHEPRVG